MPVVHHGRAIGFGQTIEMRDLEPGFFHVRQQLFRRWRSSREKLYRLVKFPFHRVRCRNHQRHDNRRAAQMGHTFIRQRRPDRLGPDLPQTDMGADDRRQRPRKTPAVAMEHGQRPQVDRMFRHRCGQGVALRQQIGTAMMRDHTLGIARRAGCVVDGNRVPFVLGHEPRVIGIAPGNKGVIVDGLGLRRCVGEFGIIVLDEQGCDRCQRQGLLHQRHEFPVHDDHLRHRMIQLERDDRRIQTGVDRMQNPAAHRHTVVTFQHRRNVGQHGRHSIPPSDPVRRQCRGQLPRPAVEIGIAAPQRAVHHRGVIGKHRRRAFQKGQRRQRLVVCWVAIQPGVVGVLRHGLRHPATGVRAFR